MRHLDVRTSNQPLWRSIAAELTADIKNGRFPSHAKLPTEPELMARFSVSRFTLRQAMSALAREGLVCIEQGRGTFVRPSPIRYRISTNVSFSENLRRQGRTASSEEVEFKEIAASDALAGVLRLAAGQIVYRIETVNFADDDPISLSVNYYPAALMPGFPETWRQSKSWSGSFRVYGIHAVHREVTHIGARVATLREAQLLRQAIAQPVLVTSKIDRDQTGRRVCFGEAVWNAERVELEVGTETEHSMPESAER